MADQDTLRRRTTDHFGPSVHWMLAALFALVAASLGMVFGYSCVWPTHPRQVLDAPCGSCVDPNKNYEPSSCCSDCPRCADAGFLVAQAETQVADFGGSPFLDAVVDQTVIYSDDGGVIATVTAGGSLRFEGGYTCDDALLRVLAVFQREIDRMDTQRF